MPAINLYFTNLDNLIIKISKNPSNSPPGKYEQASNLRLLAMMSEITLITANVDFIDAFLSALSVLVVFWGIPEAWDRFRNFVRRFGEQGLP
jgi:hypothetical protein